MDTTGSSVTEMRRALQAHIVELEELVDNLLPSAKSGSPRARDLVSSLYREVMEKRQRLKNLSQ